MRLVRGLALLVLAALSAAAAPAVPPSDTARKGLAGDWELVISSPKRPWIFLARFKPAGAWWAGTLSLRGLPDLALVDVRAELPSVRFRLPPELDSLPFEGTLAGGEISGFVVEGGEKTPARLVRIVPLPQPANRIDAWRQDLDYASSHVAAYDRSFSPTARDEFRRALEQLKLDAARKSDAEILVALSHAVALADNAHTRLRLDPTRHGTFKTTFPIRVWWFRDGPYVIRAAPLYKRALGCRLVAIDGHDVAELRRKVEGLFAGNASWGDYLSPIYMTTPDVVSGLGLVRDASQASFTFEDPRGAKFSIPVRAEPLNRDAMPGESWQELSPLTATGKPRWTTALASDPATLPLYLRHPDRPYWFEFLRESGVLYVQYNHSDNADEGPSFAEFGESLLAFAKAHPNRGVVLDLRLNSGGNLQVAKEFMKTLARNETIDRPGRLFVIIGPCTFSAGLYHAAQLKQLTHAVFVGEPAGDRLDFWAEGGEIVLPNSRAAIAYSNGFHRYSGKPYPDHEPFYEELSIPDLAPDVSAPLTSKDYFALRDPALEAIRARLQANVGGVIDQN